MVNHEQSAGSPLRFVVYTAVFGKPDVLMDPLVPLPDVDLLCFTDMLHRGETAYQVIPTNLGTVTPPVLRQRRVKIYWPYVLRNYDYSVYVDSTVELKVHPTQLLELLGDADIFEPRHPSRDCLYEEARKCLEIGLISQEVHDAQTEKYRQEGCPPHGGLYASGLIVRRHTEAIKEFSRMWWREVQEFAHRDQISLPYVAWKLGIEVSTIPYQETVNLYSVHPHQVEGSPFQL